MNYLFRAKTIESKLWKYGQIITTSKIHHTGEKTLIVLDENYNGYAGRSFIEVEPKTVSLFTGFLDKTNQRIFEGDIIATRDRKYKYYVVFENGSFICYHLELKDTVNGGNLRWGLLSRAFELKDFEIEVIGNIYDKMVE